MSLAYSMPSTMPGASPNSFCQKKLGLSLPTVSTGLRTLEKQGFIVRRGSYASTGGRPAAAYEFVPNARFAVGIELAATHVHVAVVDLYGNVLARHEEQMSFQRTDTYACQLGRFVDKSVAECQGLPHSLLGATIAIQGIVGDENRVSFGGLLGADNAQVSLDDFAPHLPGQLRFVHDAEAAAFAELWRHRELQDFTYLSLNNHLGSASISHGSLLHGGPLGAGVAEHMVLRPGGKNCYCGGKGCAETVLSVQSLEQRAHLPLDEFVKRLRTGDGGCARLWDSYLSDLALLIHNVRMVNCADLMLGGRLARHLSDADPRILKTYASQHGTLANTPFRLMRGQYGDKATVVGAGLILVDESLRPA
ncbi:MAG: ROK family transcriptional regulator [Coriobacteriales bacterium]|nr:ROK family transcriptional regulator [Coriobacteriales bacterium]